ncbi:hypothetical protein D9Y22_25305 [Methylorubrum sp. DB1722]|nr:hypothetical protein [Methylorubrum sp. DB1722]
MAVWRDDTMLLYLLCGVVTFPLIAAALWSHGIVIALLSASLGASAIAGAVAFAVNLRRTRRRRAAARGMARAKTTLAD